MIIKEVTPLDNYVLHVVASDGRSGMFDVRCYLNSPAFSLLKEGDNFAQIRNGKYYVEWVCGADLSADTLEAHIKWDASDRETLMVAEDSSEYKAGK